MPTYDEIFKDALINDDTIQEGQTSRKEVSGDYKVVTKGDDGENYYPLKESFLTTYENQEKSSLSEEVFDKMEVFTKDGKEYLGVKTDNLLKDIEPFLDKYKVTFYPDENRHEVFTSGSELSEIYKGIDVPKDLMSRWDISEDSIEMEDIDQALLGI